MLADQNEYEYKPQSQFSKLIVSKSVLKTYSLVGEHWLTNLNL